LFYSCSFLFSLSSFLFDHVHSCLIIFILVWSSSFLFQHSDFLIHSSRILMFDLNTVHKWHCRIHKVILFHDFFFCFVDFSDLFTLLECCFDYLLLLFMCWFHNFFCEQPEYQRKALAAEKAKQAEQVSKCGQILAYLAVAKRFVVLFKYA